MSISFKLRCVLPLLVLAVACAHAGPAKKETTTASAKPEASTKPTAPTSPPPQDLPQRTELPLVLRETLSSSMERHGEELTYLLASVVLLNYEQAEELAQLLAEEPKLGRPSPGDVDSLNAMLPPAFFVYQDELTKRAKTLAMAARSKNDAELGKAFGSLAETCVGCHSSYLHDEAEHDKASDTSKL